MTMWQMYVSPVLLHLWLNGPTFAGVGFWAGESAADICQELSGLPAKHFLLNSNNAEECEGLLLRQFRAFDTLVMIFSLAYLALALGWKACSFAVDVGFSVVRSGFAYGSEALRCVGKLKSNESGTRSDVTECKKCAN